jgi:PhnB protein
MRLSTHLHFNGRCRAAFEYYEKCLGGKVTMMMTYGDSPMAGRMPPELHGNIIHATFSLGDQQLTGADAPPDRFEKPQGFSVLLTVDEPAEADRVFASLSQDGSVQMPIQDTFWALRFGMVTDQFGTPWLINCGKPA